MRLWETYRVYKRKWKSTLKSQRHLWPSCNLNTWQVPVRWVLDSWMTMEAVPLIQMAHRWVFNNRQLSKRLWMFLLMTSWTNSVRGMLLHLRVKQEPQETNWTSTWTMLMMRSITKQLTAKMINPSNVAGPRVGPPKSGMINPLCPLVSPSKMKRSLKIFKRKKRCKSVNWKKGRRSDKPWLPRDSSS